MTNADKIRSMNDEELGVFLAETIEDGIEWFWDWTCSRCKTEHGGVCPTPDDDTCIQSGKEILGWLKAEAEN